MAAVKMVVVNGVRYRPEDAPKGRGDKDKPVRNKMRTTKTTASKED